MLLKLKNVTLRFPSLYAPREFEGREKYTTAFEPKTEDAHSLIDARVSPKRDTGMFNTNSNFPPVIFCDDYDMLVRTFQIADARNIKRDQLMRDLTADVEVSVYEYETRERSGTALALISVHIKAADVRDALDNFKPVGTRS